MNKQAGMSLVELVLVVAVIIILTAIVIISRNPSSEAAEERNWQRESDVTQIAQVVHQYKIHHNNNYPKTNDGDKIPSCDKEQIEVSSLSNRLVTDYLTKIPKDPLTNEEYQLCLVDKKIKVFSKDAELGKDIELIR